MAAPSRAGGRKAAPVTRWGAAARGRLQRKIAATAPPRTLFIWPGVLTVEAVLTGVEFQYRQFGNDGRALVYAANVNFEEILDVRVTSEALREEV